jgi:hypothetical protein
MHKGFVACATSRKLEKGERTMIRDLVDYAAEVANNLLVPEKFPHDMWRDLSPSERFYVRMLGMEGKGTTKVADFQNFAKSFAYGDYASLMASTTAMPRASRARPTSRAKCLQVKVIKAMASRRRNFGKFSSRSGRHWRRKIPSSASRPCTRNMPPTIGSAVKS